MKSLLSHLGLSLAILFLFPCAILAEDRPLAQGDPSKELRTIVADLLMVDGDFYIVRGERGEIRIEVTPDTKLSEEFTFGDRIKALILPNDVARSITRAAPNEPIGITRNLPTTPPVPPTPTPPSKSIEAEEAPPPPPSTTVQEIRVIIADLLMVDGDFYIVRGEYGEIQIEVTPKTQLSETFQFGDRIKARVTPNDKAISIVRASKEDVTGIHAEKAPISQDLSPQEVPTAQVPESSHSPKPDQEISQAEAPSVSSLHIRTIVADILMVDGDFYVVRGDGGEIRIEVTPKTTLSESFQFGDRIKAKVLPNDKALTIERATPDEPLGIHTP